MSDEKMIWPRSLSRLSGAESLGSSSVLEFWRWALGDLRMNTARGVLVEFLIAQALGDTSPFRVEWGPYDVKAADGTLVEIKATGRLQSWASTKLSTPKWTFERVRATRIWSDTLGAYMPVDAAARAHVWVFALHTTTVPESYDPLDVSQWEFRVIPHRQLLATNQISAGLSFFEKLGILPVTYDALQEAVAVAHRINDEMSP